MSQPNILLINCDDLGYGDLGCYGSTRNKTPHLDNMAEQGLRLTDFYVASPICSPSRGAMMTGCYPPRIGFGDFDGAGVLFPGAAIGLHQDEHTLPQLLRDAGYRTKLVGKWHCGDQPEFLPCERGFDEYYGIPFSNDMGRQVGHEHRPPLPLVRDSKVIQEQPAQAGLTERYTEECVRFIRDNQDGPFFLYLAHMYVHVPLFVPRQFLAASENGGYGGAVAHIDWTTGVLLDELRELGIDDNSIIIFTSDNGSRARYEGGSNAPCRGTKGTTWEGGQRVPCIIRWPDKITAGQTSDAITSAIDFLPTLATLAGAIHPTDRQIDGLDQSAQWLGQSAESVRDTFVYYFMDRLEAVRQGDWKLHLGTTRSWGKNLTCEEPALFNLREDVGEQTNLYADHPDIVATLQDVADSVRADLGDSFQGVEGAGRRPHGRIENPQPLTTYDPDHPYMVAMYDSADSKVMAG